MVVSNFGMALTGAGHIGVSAHLPAWSPFERTDVTWIVDSREEVARRTARKWGISWGSVDHGDALKAPDVDAVDVCTPATSYAALCFDALRSGGHPHRHWPGGPATLRRDLGKFLRIAEEEA